MIAVILIMGRRQGVLTDVTVNANHLHDVGKLMFAMTVFWTYIMFSQLMLQWYANQPEEIPYYMNRFVGGWWPYSIALFLAHFVIPFLVLANRDRKRNEKWLFRMALFMLVAQWMDAYYMVMPVFRPSGPVFGPIEIGMFLGFLGIFGTVVIRFLEKVPAVAYRDPRLPQCLAHNQ